MNDEKPPIAELDPNAKVIENQDSPNDTQLNSNNTNNGQSFGLHKPLNTTNFISYNFVDFFEVSPIGQVVMDRNGNIQQVNRAAAELFAREREDLLQTSFFDYVVGDKVSLTKHLQRVHKSGRRETVELCVRNSKNVVHHVHVYSVSYGLREHRDGCLTALVDITEHIRQQQVLKLQNTLLNKMQEGVLLVRQKDGIILETNASFDRLFGYDPGELAGQHVSNLNAEQDIDEVSQAEHIVFELRRWGHWAGEVKNVRKDGSVFWSEASVSAFDHQDYGPIWLDVHRDITWRKHAEYALSQSERFARATLNALPLAMIVLDENGKIISVNTAWRQFARDNGAPEAICEGDDITCRDLYLCGICGFCGDECGEEGRVIAGINAVIERRLPQYEMEYVCHIQKETRWYLLKATSRGNGDKGAVVTYFDVSTQKRAEASAQEQRDKLARVARLNTISALSSSLAHEITQPLTAISCFSEAAIAMVKNAHPQLDQLTDVLQDINKQVQRAAAIMRRLREFMGQGRSQKSQVDIRDIISDAVQLVEPSAQKQAIEIQRRLTTTSQCVLVDRIQIEQVMVNLLSNSIEAICSAPCESRLIEVELVAHQGEVEILVSDSGPGLDGQQIERVFDLFETNKKTGMGMGLSISRSIVEAHHGRLWADSAVNLGAVFHVSLPLSSSPCGEGRS